MNISQRFEAIQTIKKYATLIGQYTDHQGGYCAAGALMLVATNDPHFMETCGLSTAWEKAKVKFGLVAGVIDQLIDVNDEYEDPLQRRAALIEYLESLTLTQ